MRNFFIANDIEKEVAALKLKKKAKNGLGRREVAEIVRALQRKATTDGMVEYPSVILELAKYVKDEEIIEGICERLFCDVRESSHSMISVGVIEQELKWIFQPPSLEKFHYTLQADFKDHSGPVKVHGGQRILKGEHPKRRTVKDAWLEIEGCRPTSPKARPIIMKGEEKEAAAQGPAISESESSANLKLREILMRDEQSRKVEVVALAVKSRRVKADDLEQVLADLIPQLETVSAAVTSGSHRSSLWAKRESAREQGSVKSPSVVVEPVDVDAGASLAANDVCDQPHTAEGGNSRAQASTMTPGVEGKDKGVSGRRHVRAVRFLGDGESEEEPLGGDTGALDLAVEGEAAARTAFDLCSWAQNWLSDLLEVSCEGDAGDGEGWRERFREGLGEVDGWSARDMEAEAEAADAEFGDLALRAQHLLLLYEGLRDRRAGQPQVGPIREGDVAGRNDAGNLRRCNAGRRRRWASCCGGSCRRWRLRPRCASADSGAAAPRARRRDDWRTRPWCRPWTPSRGGPARPLPPAGQLERSAARRLPCGWGATARRRRRGGTAEASRGAARLRGGWRGCRPSYRL